MFTLHIDISMMISHLNLKSDVEKYKKFHVILKSNELRSNQILYVKYDK